jgi:hypothetical protein
MDGAKLSLSKYICAHKGVRKRYAHEAEEQTLHLKHVGKTGRCKGFI